MELRHPGARPGGAAAGRHCRAHVRPHACVPPAGHQQFPLGALMLRSQACTLMLLGFIALTFDITIRMHIDLQFTTEDQLTASGVFLCSVATSVPGADLLEKS